MITATASLRMETAVVIYNQLSQIGINKTHHFTGKLSKSPGSETTQCRSIVQSGF